MRDRWARERRATGRVPGVAVPVDDVPPLEATSVGSTPIAPAASSSAILTAPI